MVVRKKKAVLKNSKEKDIALSKKKSVRIPTTNNHEIQDGTNPKGKHLTNVPEGKATVGLSVGITLNMGDYQSARIDVFMQRNVDDDEVSIKDALTEISDLLHEEIERQATILED